ncbi:cytochrome c oxidase subunit 3 [Wenxinia marina]|uniref:Cytochrome bo(3) ubiquinol oxidase subunit 3 n=1 Tax=Wenxinia marina DSM 24838 TaxID=1123501 RepID=A0A0D0Q7H9_9RHOB|nr:cytochrome c oxidase subunit 3 [Wenxinia marina]KIQ70404.1 cytochrome bo3 quinol oxidase subunit 3 [Wenxinia marina DSM 24838]GGL53448.1 cytochrome o ubiquinol oxidase subunit III [Wenxinia marina]
MSDVRHPGLNLGTTDSPVHDAAEETVFGFWVLMMSDLALFAVLFATYAAMSVHGIAGGPAPVEIFDLKSTLWQTLALLASSFTFGMAALALKYDDDRRALSLWLGATFVLGALFLGLEARDWARMVTEHGATPQVSGFLSIFYLLTGTHFVHVAAGLLWMLVMAAQLAIFGLDGAVKLRLMRLAIYWHLLDVVWVAIFSFVFLSGLAP